MNGDPLATSQEKAAVPCVLVVQGDIETAYTLRKVLKAKGYDPRTAVSGFEALGIVQAVKPAAIVLDLDMPGLSGLKLLQQIRDHTPDSKILVVTDHSDEYAPLASKMGIAELLPKPFTTETLLRHLVALVPPVSPA